MKYSRFGVLFTILLSSFVFPLPSALNTGPQIPPSSPSDRDELEMQAIRDVNRTFFDMWLIQGNVTAAASGFSQTVFLYEDEMDGVFAESGNHKHEKWDRSDAKKFRARLADWLDVMRGLAVQGNELKDVLSLRFLIGPDSHEKSAINNIRIDRYALFRYRAPQPGSNENLGEFRGSFDRLKNVKPNECFYVTFFCIALKTKDGAYPLYAIWRKENDEWRIVEFAFLTD